MLSYLSSSAASGIIYVSGKRGRRCRRQLWGSKNDGPPASLSSRPFDGGRRVPLSGVVSDAIPNHRRTQPHRWGDRAWSGRWLVWGPQDSEGRVTGDPTADLVMLPSACTLPCSRPSPVLAPLQRSFPPPDPQSRNDSLGCVVFPVHSKGDHSHLPTPTPSPPLSLPLDHHKPVLWGPESLHCAEEISTVL